MPELPSDVFAPLRLKEMLPGAVADVIARDSRLLIPVGTCQQHGPHLPMGCDTIIVDRLADDLSAEARILRAPTVEYGVNSTQARAAPGNATLRRKTLLRTLNDLTDGWEEGGITEFILLTAHGHDGHVEALSTVITMGARVRVVDILAIDFSDLIIGEYGPLHGDEVETALLLHVAPELVELTRAQDYMIARDAVGRYRRGSLRVPAGSAGSLGRPSVAAAATGEAIYARIRSKILERIILAPPALE
ncbi:MAG: creatininase family protein [Gemmatimonadaceae bacterium]